MRIVVEERHIKAGTSCDEQLCPIALAIAEEMTRLYGGTGSREALMGQVASDWEVLVGSEYITIIFADGREKKYMTPWEVTDIITEYDETGVMHPFGFEL